jgi:predicted ATPase
MLKTLKLSNFTVFEEVEFEFASGLNVFVGENGAGKTHVLKVAYSVLASMPSGIPTPPSKSQRESRLADKLSEVFKPDRLGHLVRSGAQNESGVVDCSFSNSEYDLNFSISSVTESDIEYHLVPTGIQLSRAVFFPTRELLSIFPNFVSLYETTHLRFEGTWRDTCLYLGAPLLKDYRQSKIKELLAPLEVALGGTVELDQKGSFYLKGAEGRREIHLVAEGHRKLAMLAQLIANGSLSKGSYLFWDEPEANLNPLVIKVVAKVILQLCLRGIQVFLASHSLFLLRELDILLQTKEFKSIPARFFGLHSAASGVRVHQGPTIDDIGEITSLQEELSQSDRYLELET